MARTPPEILDALRHDQQVQLRKLLEQNPIDLNEAEVVCDMYGIDDPDEIPLVFWAAQSGVSREAIEILMAHGLDITWTNRDGLGVLDIAIKSRRRDLVDLCVEHGVPLTESRRRSGLTPLMLAASFGDKEMVDYLLERGASVDATDKRGMDAIEYARMLGYLEMKKYLEEKKGSQKEKQGV